MIARGIARGARAALVALMLAMGGCYEAVIDVGPGGDTDPCSTGSVSCDPFRRAPDGEVAYTLGGEEVKLVPRAASQIGATIALIAIAPDGSEFDLRVWASSEGTFRCADPATAQRTRLDLIAPNYAYFLSTIGDGQCEIEIAKLPRPGATWLEGTFTGYLVQWAPNLGGPPEVWLTLGSFRVDVPPL
jgi:hypothetical protein